MDATDAGDLLDLREHYYTTGMLVRPAATIRSAEDDEEAPFIRMGNMLAAMRFGG